MTWRGVGLGTGVELSRNAWLAPPAPSTPSPHPTPTPTPTWPNMTWKMAGAALSGVSRWGGSTVLGEQRGEGVRGQA
jgi:hypothetical protein